MVPSGPGGFRASLASPASHVSSCVPTLLSHDGEDVPSIRPCLIFRAEKRVHRARPPAGGRHVPPGWATYGPQEGDWSCATWGTDCAPGETSSKPSGRPICGYREGGHPRHQLRSCAGNGNRAENCGIGGKGVWARAAYLGRPGIDPRRNSSATGPARTGDKTTAALLSPLPTWSAVGRLEGQIDVLGRIDFPGQNSADYRVENSAKSNLLPARIPEVKAGQLPLREDTPGQQIPLPGASWCYRGTQTLK